MKVLFVSLSNFRAFNSSGIYGSLLSEFIENGHHVTAISPHTNDNKRVEIFHKGKSKIIKPYIRPITKQSMIKKGINTLLFPYLIHKQLRGYINYQDYDLLIYPTPPTSLAPLIKKIKKENKNIKTFLLLKDIFPQNAIDLSILSKGLIYFYFRQQEKELYEISDYIGCMSNANKQFILQNNDIEKHKVDIVPNSIKLSDKLDTVTFQEKEELKIKWKIPRDKIIYVYAGNLGKPQSIDYMTKNIEHLKKHQSSIHFLICGRGTEANTVKKLSKDYPNLVTYLGALDKTEADEVVKASDYGLILLDYRFTIPNYPSRLLSYLEYGKPVIAATDLVTDIKELIEENQIGFWTESIDYNLVEVVEKSLLIDEIEYGDMSRRSLEVLKENFDVKDSYLKIIEMIKGDLNV